jgi:serine O-acetyltransferase
MADQPPSTQRHSELARKIVATFGATISTDARSLAEKNAPSEGEIVRLIQQLLSVVYFGYYGDHVVGGDRQAFHVEKLLVEIQPVLSHQIWLSVQLECPRDHTCPHCHETAMAITRRFLEALPEIRRALMLDVQAAFDGDPAAKSLAEIILAYPGLRAITIYRLAHALLRLGVGLMPRMMTEHAHQRTGIDIHPGARIGESFFIDHGTGVVIGETTDIGKNVKIYQGVTLGALSFPKDERGKVIREGKRHPTIEDDVVIYAGATILGGTTVIGTGSIIGGNTWVTHSLPPGTRVVTNPQEQRIAAS